MYVEVCGEPSISLRDPECFMLFRIDGFAPVSEALSQSVSRQDM